MKKALLYFTPCVIVIIMLLVMMISAYTEKEISGGWSMLAIIIFLPYLIALVITDVITRIVVKNNLKVLWLVEIIAIICMIVIFEFQIHVH